MAKVYATPGVYIEELSAFPNSAVPVATAVPAFIGYTKIAMWDKKDLHNVPTRISSFGEYILYFGEEPPTKLTLAKDDVKGYTLSISSGHFFLYQSMKLFFANGGSDCYIVSIGDYSKEPKLDDFNFFDDQNPRGISTLLKEPEPTMLVIPDAMLLAEEEYGEVHKWMLLHCEKMASRFSILDVYMNMKDGNDEKKPNTRQVVNAYRDKIGTNALKWGASYYPWLRTNLVGADRVNFSFLSDDSLEVLKGLIKEEVEKGKAQGIIADKRAESINKEVEGLKPGLTEDAITLLHQTLWVVSPLYKAIMSNIREKINLMPPSAGLAGIYSMVDNNVGVFQAPANVSIGSVVQPFVGINNDEQEDLNVPLNGKAVNAIRTFPGKGILIWGARTLDGNSQDWRYISVRRTVIFIEQSIKYAAEPYVFQPNTSATWTNIKALITNFLTNVWQSGALAGAVPQHAFSVDVGLGTTMTPVDILDGVMRITVKIAVTKPAEFIVITFQQKMQES